PWRTRPPTPASTTSPPSRSSHGVTDMPAVPRRVLTDSIAAAGALTAHPAAGRDGGAASAARNTAGFACTDAASGEVLAIDQLGTTVAIAGEQIAAGAELEVGSGGKLVTQDAGVTVARAVQAASADGAEFEVFIIPN